MAGNHIRFIALYLVGQRHRGLFFHNPLTELGRHLLHITPIQRQFVGRLILDSRVLYLLYVSASLPWRQTLAGAMVVESGQLIAHSLTLHAATDGGHTKRQERL